MILTKEDFKEGKFLIPQNENLCDTQIEKYIERYEKRYLIDLLGVELYNLFITDFGIDNLPINPIYVKIYDELYEDINQSDWCICDNKKQIQSRGIKSMLQGFLFFEIMRDFANARTLTGLVRRKSENADNIENSQFGLYAFYNESISDYKNIQYYIKTNSETYPTFNGICKKVTSWF